MNHWKFDFPARVLACVTVFSIFSASPALAVVNQDEVNALIKQASSAGSVPVIVGVKNDLTFSKSQKRTHGYDRQTMIKSLQRRLIERMTATGAKLDNVKIFSGEIPYIAFITDSAGIRVIATDANVDSIQQDVAVPASLDSSTPVMDFDDVHWAGMEGTNQTIAILDTGVRKSHSWFQSRVVSEACYSSDVPSQGASSLCPNGDSSSTEPDSGLNCSSSISGCDHGTHVAGIAAGNNLAADGAAPAANIIAIQIFSKFKDDPPMRTSCADSGLSSPCVLSYTSDQMSGLVRVNELRDVYNIASANLSLGGGGGSGTCDADARKSIIDELRENNIATVIAAGNGYSTDAMDAPACISTSISVCSTTDADVFSSFTNVSASTDVCAIGSNIKSSVSTSDNSVGIKSGTSMATPFVSGLIALLKQKGCETIDEIENVLESSGLPLLDTRSGGVYAKPRIDADNAVAMCQSTPVPEIDDDDAMCFPIKSRNGNVVVICL